MTSTLRFGTVLLALALGGCVQEEIINALSNPPITAGGQLQLSMHDGAAFKVPAIAGTKNEPLYIVAQTQEVVFWLGAAELDGGGSPRDKLGEGIAAAVMTLSSTSANRIEVHAGGKSCVADAGTITLTTGGDKKLNGEFHVSGLIKNTTTPCSIDGALGAIPVDKER